MRTTGEIFWRKFKSPKKGCSETANVEDPILTMRTRYNLKKTHRWMPREAHHMILELKPEQQQLLDRATQSGMSAEEVLDQAFAVIREQYRDDDWMHEDREAISAQIAEGYEQSEKGALMNPESAMRILRKRRAKRQIA